VPSEEVIDVQLHFFWSIIWSERLQTREKCASASIRSNRGKQARERFFFVPLGHALFDFSVKNIFSREFFFARFFLVGFARDF
jgi:hypothetical protein